MKNQIGEQGKVKIFHTSDWHIDQLSNWSRKKGSSNLEISEFSEYHLSKISEMVDYAISNNYNIFIFAGDLYSDSIGNYKEKSTINKELITLMTKLKDHGIYTIFLSGNHDITKRITIESKVNNLELFYNIDYGDYLFVNESRSQELDYKDYSINGIDIRIVLLPYLRGEITKKEISTKLKETFDKNKKNIIVGHLDIFGALYNGIEIQSLDLEDINTWSPDELEEFEYDLVLLGHVHNHQKLGKRKSVIYCGSPFRLSFNEEFSPKGFYTHSITNEKISSKFIELNNIKWKSFIYNVEENEGSFQKLLSDIKKEDLEGSIVRVVFDKILESEKKYIPYKELEELLSSKGVFNIRPYTYKTKYLEVTKDLSLLSGSLSQNEEIDSEEFSENNLLNPEYILKNLLKNEKGLSVKEKEEYIEDLKLLIEEINSN